MIHHTALIGEPPEHRAWTPGTTTFYPHVARTAKVGAFVTVDAGLRARTTVGERTWLMKHVHVGHDAVIGDDCELAPGTVVGGHCVIGDRVRIGVNACLRPFVTVGDGARIGAGAVVIRDIPPGEVWVGNPAKRMLDRNAIMHTESEERGWQELLDVAPGNWPPE